MRHPHMHSSPTLAEAQDHAKAEREAAGAKLRASVATQNPSPANVSAADPTQEFEIYTYQMVNNVEECHIYRGIVPLTQDEATAQLAVLQAKAPEALSGMVLPVEVLPQA